MPLALPIPPSAGPLPKLGCLLVISQKSDWISNGYTQQTRRECRSVWRTACSAGLMTRRLMPTHALPIVTLSRDAPPNSGRGLGATRRFCVISNKYIKINDQYNIKTTKNLRSKSFPSPIIGRDRRRRVGRGRRRYLLVIN